MLVYAHSLYPIKWWFQSRPPLPSNARVESNLIILCQEHAAMMIKSAGQATCLNIVQKTGPKFLVSSLEF
jgi:hypothetical protein